MSRSRQKMTFYLLPAVLFLAVFSGCDDSARKPIQAHTIQIAPPPQAEPVLPLPTETHAGPALDANPVVPNGITVLVAESNAAFDAGEVDFRAGHLGKARD